MYVEIYYNYNANEEAKTFSEKNLAGGRQPLEAEQAQLATAAPEKPLKMQHTDQNLSMVDIDLMPLVLRSALLHAQRPPPPAPPQLPT